MTHPRTATDSTRFKPEDVAGYNWWTHHFRLTNGRDVPAELMGLPNKARRAVLKRRRLKTRRLKRAVGLALKSKDTERKVRAITESAVHEFQPFIFTKGAPPKAVKLRGPAPDIVRIHVEQRLDLRGNVVDQRITWAEPADTPEQDTP